MPPASAGMAALLYFITGIGTLVLASRALKLSRAAALVLLLLPVVLTGRALFTGAIYGPVDLAYSVEPLSSIAVAQGVDHVTNPSISDTYTQFFPWNEALRRSIRLGQWPLWNPYEMCGAPLAGAAQVGAYHPITWVGLLVPQPAYFSFAASMLYLIAAVSAFLLIRDLVAREEPALFGAAAWMASTHLVFFAGTALANSISVLPLVLFGARRLVLGARPGQTGGRGVATLTIGLLLLLVSGHPETSLHVVTVAVLYVVFEAWILRPVEFRKLIPRGLAAGIGALLLAAVFVLPHLEAIRQSEEFVHRALGYRQKSSTPAQMGHRLAANFFPFVEGAPGLEEPPHSPEVRHGWIGTSYAGALLFGPVLVALLRARTREKRFFAGLLAAGLAAAIAAPGFTHVMNLLPGFSIAVNDRMVAFATLALAVLAAIGLDEALRGDRKSMAIALFATAVVIVAAAIGLGGAVSPDFLRLGVARALIPVLLAAVVTIGLPVRHHAAIFLALLLLQRAGETSALQPVLPAKAFYPPFVGLAEIKSPEPFRIVATGQMLPPALSTHYRLEDVRAFQAVTLARLDATYPLWCKRQPVWFNRVDDLGSPMLDLMNVRFALTSQDTPIPAGWRVTATTPGYTIVENLDALPRAFVPRVVHLGRSQEAALAEMASAKNFGEESWIEEGTARQSAANGPGTVELRASGGRMELHARMDGAGWVVISNTAWNGWQSPRPIRFANHAFMAIFLPRGEHHVELVYRPRSFVLGAAISLLTLAVQITVFVRRRRTLPATR